MKIHYEIEQGTEEWHRIRWGKISGTNSKGLFVDSDTLLTELVSCRLEEFKQDEEPYINENMLRGIELEPFARMQISRKIGVKFKTPGWVQSYNPIMGISPDSISECETIATEIKCPSKNVHMATVINGDIPSTNIHQCLHYFTVIDSLKELHFGSYRPECKLPLFHKVLTRESVINLGTKSRPNLKSVDEWVELARKNSNELLEKVNQTIEKLC